jgi:hypothetical protein
MCCLSYEADAYREIKSKLPKIGSVVKTKEAEGRVVGHNIYENKIGLYVPIAEILKRTKYEYFTRMSAMQILQSQMIISKYVISSLGSAIDFNREEYNNEKQYNAEIRNKYVGFWKLPSNAPVYGLRPSPFANGYLIKSGQTTQKP